LGIGISPSIIQRISGKTPLVIKESNVRNRTKVIKMVKDFCIGILSWREIHKNMRNAMLGRRLEKEEDSKITKSISNKMLFPINRRTANNRV
jgi:hypothetical protein